MTMPHGRWSTMNSRKSGIVCSWWAYLLLILIILNLVPFVPAAPHNRTSLKTVRLCSRSLSDALYLLCKGRGYNEPFNASSGGRARRSAGPGLVEECCYNACSFEQMEQYCKPATTEDKSGSQVANDGAVEIVTLPNCFTDPHKRFERLRKRSADKDPASQAMSSIFQLPHRKSSDFRLEGTGSSLVARGSKTPANRLDLSR